MNEGKNKSRMVSKKILTINQKRENGGLDTSGSSTSDEKQLYSGHILKQMPI